MKKLFFIALAAVILGPWAQLPADENPTQKLYVLSPEWLVWMADENKETDARILAENREFFEQAIRYQENLERGEPVNWVLLKQRAAVYQSEFARLSRQHLDYSKPSAFSIQSAKDKNYSPAKNPLDSIVWVHSLGDGQPMDPLLRDCRAHQPGHCYYLRLPLPLKNGSDYTLTRSDGKNISFLYEEATDITPSIKVNQIGYLPDASEKYAYLGAWVPGRPAVDFSKFPVFQLKDAATGQVVKEAAIEVRADVGWKPEQQMEKTNATYCGETVYQMPFGDFAKEGRYYVFVPGLGRSHDFLISKQAAGESFYTQMRGFYQQRCGTPLEKPFTNWVRNACHTKGVHPCGLPGNGAVDWKGPDGKSYSKIIKNSDFEVIKVTGDTSKTFDISGGWHDAADYDRRQSHHFAIWDMLGAYELNPQAFTDGQLNLPESTNGIPDLLDEAIWGIEVWMKAQLPSGAVPGRLEETSHPSHLGMPDKDPQTWFVGLPTSGSSRAFAASAAWLSRLIAPFDKKLADDLQAHAIRAYDWALTNDESAKPFEVTLEVKNKQENGPVTLHWKESPRDSLFEGLLAAVELEKITGDPRFHKDVMERFAPDGIRFFKSWPNHATQLWPIFQLATSKDKYPEQTTKAAGQELIKIADERLQMIETNPYRHPWNAAKSRRWSAALPATYARYLIMAERLTGNAKYRKGVELCADFHLGCNPLGMSHTTGLGYRFPIGVQDVETRSDDNFEPVPGLTPYGIISVPFSTVNEVMNMTVKDPRSQEPEKTISFLPEGFTPTDPEVPLWRRISPHSKYDPLNNEFTLQETLSPAVLMFASLLQPGWMPSEDLKKRGPRNAAELTESWFRIP
jgi:endoglucanase